MEHNSLINHLIATFNYAEILSRYKIYKIVNNKKANSYNDYAKFYQAIKMDIEPLAHAREKNYTIIALDINKEMPSDFKYEYTLIQYVELKRTRDTTLMNLLFSLLAKESTYFDIGTDPYGLYYLAEIKEQKDSSFNTITTLRIGVDAQMYLTLNVVSFRKIYNNNKIDLKKDRYVINGNKLVRSNIVDEKECYIKGARKGTKNSFPFMNFSYGYEDTKMSILHQFITSFKKHFKDIASIEFDRLDMNLFEYGDGSSDAIKIVKDSVLSSFSGAVFNIINYTDLELDDEITVLKQKFLDYFSNSVVVKNTKRLGKNDINITITFSKKFYQENKISDPYIKIKKSKAISQNINIAKGKIGVNNTILHVLLKELLIKQDIKNRRISITRDITIDGFTFIQINKQKIPEDTIYNKIYVKGLDIAFRELTDTEIEHCNRCVSYAESDKKEIEAVIIADDGSVNYIVKTRGFMLPELEDISRLYDERVKEVKPINKKKVLDVFDKAYSQDGVVISDETTQLISSNRDKINSLRMIDDTNIDLQMLKKYFSSKEELKEVTKSFKKSILELVDSSIIFNIKAKSYINFISSLSGIKYNEDNYNYSVYSVGISSIHKTTANMPKAIKIREIHLLRGKLLTKQILEMMSEYFVKNGEFTVLPYPIKYIREYYKI